MAEPPGANPMSTANPDAELVARGERFEKFLLEYMDAWLEWAPLMRAARACSSPARPAEPRFGPTIRL
jgi:hypothetical protein